MEKRNMTTSVRTAILLLTLAASAVSFAQEVIPVGATAKPVFKQEDLDQILAPIALHPDSLISQILMASTYPLEVVQADRWVKANKTLNNSEVARALEAQSWDPSVKSLVNFPQVLDMMSAKLDWTQKLGDAVLAQQKEVMATIQKLRQKAQAEGNLKSTAEQYVAAEQETQTIIVESVDPEVIYVPIYDPNVVYGTWWWPSYPPYYYYPPGYAYGSAGFHFAAGVAIGAAWGYAWGHCNWHGGDVDINIDRNRDINPNIDRSAYAARYNQGGQAGKGQWQHDVSHRGGVAYRDPATAQRYNRTSPAQASQAREAYRGYGDGGRQDLSRDGAGQLNGRAPSAGNQASRPSQDFAGGARETQSNRTPDRSAFEGIDRGSTAKQQSSRGQQSLSGGARSGSGGGMSRGGGGGGRRR